MLRRRRPGAQQLRLGRPQHGIVRIPIDAPSTCWPSAACPRGRARPRQRRRQCQRAHRKRPGPEHDAARRPARLRLTACRQLRPQPQSRDRKGAPALRSKVASQCFIAFALAAFAASAQPGQPAPAQPSYSMQDSNLKPALPGALQGVGIDQKLNQQIPARPHLPRRGRPHRAALHFLPGNKPVILAPVYYRCPMLCTQILNGAGEQPQGRLLQPGKDFEVVAVSFDPKDTPETAAAKKQNLPAALRPPRHGQRLALPDRRRGQYQGAHRRRRLSLQVRSQDRPVRARQRHHDRHARRPPLAILLRRGIRPARCAPGPGGGFRGQDRHPGGLRFCCSATTTIPATGKYGAVGHEYRCASPAPASCCSAARSCSSSSARCGSTAAAA